MKILGMKKESYVGQVCEGHNGNFEYKDEEMERHHLYLENQGSFYQLTLEMEYGQCGSGWTTAEWVEVSLKEIDKVPEDMLQSKVDKELDMIDENSDSYHCDFFSFNKDGGDSYYPSGYYGVNEDLFGKLS